MKIDIDKTKQQENMQKLIEMDNNEVEDKEEKNPIYDYLKQHPTIFISIISGLVVAIGFLFNCIIYTNECKYLEYWNLNQQLINVNSKHQIYELVIISFMFFGLIFIEIFLLISINRYFKVKKEFWETRILRRKVKRKCKKLKKQNNRRNKELLKKRNNNLVKEEIKNKESHITELGKYLEQYKLAAGDVKKKIRKETNAYIVLIFTIALLLVTGIGYIFLTMFSVTVNYVQIIITIVAIFCTLWFLALVGLRIGYSIDMHSALRKLDVEEQFKKHLNLFEEIEKKEKYSIQKWFDFNLKNLLIKDNIICATIYFLFLLFIFIGWIGASTTKQIEENKIFDIIEYEDTCYAIMYRDDKYFYLEEVEIHANDIYIHVNNQLRLSSEGLYSVNREFEHAYKILDVENE